MAQSSLAALAKRKIGSLEVSALGLGCMSLSGSYGPSDDAVGLQVIHRALDEGITLLDTSDAYGQGHNEQLIGKAVKDRRDNVVVATKFGNLGGRDGKFADGRPEFVISSCEASLKRLGIETIDLYYQHRIDPLVPIEDTVGAMSRLVEQGKVRALGLSEASPATIRRAHKVHPIAAVQNEFSLLYRVDAEDTLPTLRELGITFVAYSPLGRGLLTGKPDNPATMSETDNRRRHPRFATENYDRNVALAQKLDAIAKQKGCTTGQLVLAWLLAQGDDIVPIPGTKKIERLLENLGALSVNLSAGDVAAISTAIPAGTASGTRYPAPQMASIHL